MKHLTCDECGSRIGELDDLCSLCGWVTQRASAAAEGGSSHRDDAESEIADSQEAGASTTVRDSVGERECQKCGVPSTTDAKFCSQCGTRLNSQAQRTAPTSKAIGRQLAATAGSGMGLVVTLFLVSGISKSNMPLPETEENISSTVSGTEELGGVLGAQVARLDSLIAEAAGVQRTLRLREKLLVLHDAGRTDLAAAEQMKVAESTGNLEDWKLAGDLFYDAMTAEADPSAMQRLAAGAVLAYGRTLTLDPENLDVRTDLATAYLNTGDPMKGVVEIKRVLESDPNHLNANFNYGLMLARINRTDQAVAQLQKVRALANPGSEHFRRASEILVDIERREGA